MIRLPGARHVGKLLYLAISAHGYGHIGQTAPVINETLRRLPELEIVIECAAPRDVLEKRFSMPFVHVTAGADFGMVMKDAFTVDVEASHARYAGMHADLERHVAAAQARMELHRPDVLFANVPYVPLIAARRMGIPALAMSSLNWAHIFAALCPKGDSGAAIQRDMLEGYGAARAFIAPAPSMSMPGLDNVVGVGPLASLAASDRRKLASCIGAADSERMVMVSMGGIATELDLEKWPAIAGVTWLVDKPVPAARPDIATIGGIGMSFLGVMASCDALVTKPGYGSFVEAACNGVPVLYVPRDDWPEASCLTRWLHEHGRCIEVPRRDLQSSRLEGYLQALWDLPGKPRVAPTGVAQAADILVSCLSTGEEKLQSKAGQRR